MNAPVATPVRTDLVLTVNDLVTEYRVSRRASIRAVDHVSFSLERGETLGIVGESGCGKSTLVRTLIGLEQPASGDVTIDGIRIDGASQTQLQKVRRAAQMVFQDPYSSLDPHMTMEQAISQPWQIHRGIVPKRARHERARDLAHRVGLDPGDLDRRVTTFSGGQRQRIGIARALAVEPTLLLLDEPVSALDVSIQAQIIELLRGLQDELGLSMVLISHDLSVVRSIAHRVGVMYLGAMVELGRADDLYTRPQHPYTRALLSAVPSGRSASGQRILLTGELPSPAHKPSGCYFHTRCWKATAECLTTRPELRVVHGTHKAACFHPTAEE